LFSVRGEQRRPFWIFDFGFVDAAFINFGFWIFDFGVADAAVAMFC
jgi:hypothetical protein